MPTIPLSTFSQALPLRRPSPLLALLGLCLTGFLAAHPAGAQVCGDVNGDDKVSTSDAQAVLKVAVGQPVDLICEDCSELEARVAVLEALLANVTIDGDNLVLTGMNLQVVNGTGDTDGNTNGTGNVIIGYDESDDKSDEKDGSHNLVVGRYHSYSTYGGIVAGEDNVITGESASVLGGVRNEADGDGAVVVGGISNQADGETSVVIAGELNRSFGRSCVITTGTQNLCTGLASGVSGGSQNFCSGAGSVIGGTSNRNFGSNLGFMAGNITVF